ncbi:hypothetical protein LGN21_19510 [Burkholderia cepacia]|uniref:hypothetical protein n=1 Tax=Burkholderia cepacia TaxID=292 RepID=UPI001CF1BC32|nr:hypothetical protein [Burkholderia cepacia]MCA8118030.1 hypothetical protein [Burkholderia cepacia]MCA8281779.1 hypothetical protein [Burkholderia cepacia]
MNEHHAPNPIAEVLRAYWKADRWMLLTVAAVVVLSSASAVAAPYLFSRLIDALSHRGVLHALIPGFVLYAVLLGLSHGTRATARPRCHGDRDHPPALGHRRGRQGRAARPGRRAGLTLARNRVAATVPYPRIGGLSRANAACRRYGKYG